MTLSLDAEDLARSLVGLYRHTERL